MCPQHGVIKDPCQTKFQFCRVPRMGGIKLQLLCGVRIELAVGSLPYPGESGFPIVSPGRDRPLSGFPICKSCLDVRQNPSRDTHLPSYGRRPLPKPKPNTAKKDLRFNFPSLLSSNKNMLKHITVKWIGGLAVCLRTLNKLLSEISKTF